MAALAIALVVVLAVGIAVGALVTADRHDEARAELDAAEQRLVSTWAALIARWSTYARARGGGHGAGTGARTGADGGSPGDGSAGDRSAGDEDRPRAA
jgi:hypothetical protein